MAGGTTVELAMHALFQLCVPAVSGGAYSQTFPAELIVALTDEERIENQIDKKVESYRIKSDDGFILFQVEIPYCMIITADGNPSDAIAPFKRRLADLGGKVVTDEDTDEHHNITGEVGLTDGAMISIILATRKETDAQGFYGSASMWKPKR